MELVSVVVPVYNAEKYIKETMMSIANQTYSNLEIILVDDGGTDNSIRIAESVLVNNQYQIIQQTNMGLSAARNTGIVNATGKYICFVDSDDIIAPTHIESLVKLASKNGLSVCFSEFESTSENNRYGCVCENDSAEILSGYYIRRKFALRKIQIHACALLLDLDFLRGHDLLFNPVLRFGEDAEFIWRMLFETEKIGYLHQKSYKYLTREGSLMTSPTLDKAVVFAAELKKALNQIANEKSVDQNFLNDIYNRILFGLYRSYSMFSSEEVWREFLEAFPARKLSKQLFHLRDWRVVILANILYVNPNLFRAITRTNTRKFDK